MVRNVSLTNQVSHFMVMCQKWVSSPCPEKIEAIKSLKPPTNVYELRSYLGMVTYCGRFINDLATVIAPLRKLTKKDVKFEWTESQQQSFDTLQAILSEKITLS